jgi:glycosyltransferase involved in cell wall biosynthesis
MTSRAAAQVAPSPTPVTVLMPVYNGDAHVRGAVESVLAQTHAHFELLIVDDGSTDSTPEILGGYATRDPRVRVLRHANMDQPATLNRGLREARHDWVAILDHDDVCFPRRLERQLLALAREPEARVIGSWAVEINAEGEVIGCRTAGPATVAEFRALHAHGQRVPLVHPSVLLHRPTVLKLGGYDPAFRSSADTELWTRVAHRHPIVVAPEPLVMYRIHSRSMSYRRLFEQRALLRLILERDEARRCGEPLPTLEQHRSQRPPWSARRWRELQHDLFWYFRSHCLLHAAEGARASAAALALCAAAVSPLNAVRLVRRRLRALTAG